MIRALLTSIIAVTVIGQATPTRAQGEWVYDDGEEKKKEKKGQEEIKAREGGGGGQPAGEAAAGEGKPKRAEEDGIDPAERSPIDGVKGHIGIGYFTDFAPLGMRYWFTRDWALDVGIDGSFSSGNLDGYQLGFDVGGVYAIAHYHYAVAITRVGIGYRVNGTTGASALGARHDVIINAFLGVELFLGAFGFPNVSLQGGYGVQATWLVEGGTNFVIGASDPSLNVVSSGAVGFHIYL